jgi:hypothetical protein
MLLKSMALNLSRQLRCETGEARALLLAENTAGSRVTGQSKGKFHYCADVRTKHNLLVEQGECYEAEVQLYDNWSLLAIPSFSLAGHKETDATALKYTDDYLHLRGRASEALTKQDKEALFYWKKREVITVYSKKVARSYRPNLMRNNYGLNIQVTFHINIEMAIHSRDEFEAA